ncbi:hypothetical protein LWI29_005891 [Acer saccharum]|uniref:Uncharacterized protein n=1 Tax=Acer saccharum TaxID=4024 RepID=A0AA39SPX0_ACESA|nr:hypothetical protein LWI29_005891 [Acer saccharum]
MEIHRYHRHGAIIQILTYKKTYSNIFNGNPQLPPPSSKVQTQTPSPSVFQKPDEIEISDSWIRKSQTQTQPPLNSISYSRFYLTLAKGVVTLSEASKRRER